jgi:hypothetical protein
VLDGHQRGASRSSATSSATTRSGAAIGDHRIATTERHELGDHRRHQRDGDQRGEHVEVERRELGDHRDQLDHRLLRYLRRMWSDRPLSTITLADLQSLITDKVRENRQLDYKDEQPAHPRANDDKKSDFAVDVSALANGSGGLLVYGVAEERDGGRPTGIASALNGLADFNLDADGNQLRNYLGTALDPKLPVGSLELHAVEGGTRGPLLLVRVRKSFAAPHMVRFRNAFYVRDGAQNRQLDTRGIREAIYASGDWANRFRVWRRDRIAAVLSAETPIQLEGTRRLIVHIAPTSSLEGETSVDVRDAQRRAVAKQVAPFVSRIEYATDTFNVDGFVIHSRAGGQDYLQFFRSGLVESVDASLLYGGDELGTRAIEDELFKFVPMCAAYLMELGVLPPLVVALTLTGVQGMHHREQPSIDRVRKAIPTIDRDVVAVPELLLDAEQLATDPRAYLAPIVNGLWQAGGRPGCPRYKDDGTYDGTRSYS